MIGLFVIIFHLIFFAEVLLMVDLPFLCFLFRSHWFSRPAGGTRYSVLALPLRTKRVF